MPAANGKIASIQVLRGLAACAVVVFHSVDRINTGFGASLQPMTDLASLGPSGVDLFFLISGFLMTHLHRSWFGQGAALKFFGKRCARIVPLYWTLSALALALLLAAPQLHTNARAFTLPWLLGNFLFFPWPQPSGAVVHAVMVGWTLDYEMYFYVLFALAMGFRRGLLLITATLTMSYVAGLVLHPQHPWLRLLTDGLLLEFLAGVGLALLLEQVPRSQRTRRGGVLLTIVGLGLWLASLSIPHVARQWRWGVPLALVFLGVLWMELQCRSLLGRAFVLLGEASYSIYLFQVFALSGAFALLQRVGASALPAPICVFALCVLTCLAGIACWRFLERPLGRLIASASRRDASASVTASSSKLRSAPATD